jgi:hypothetical protein
MKVKSQKDNSISVNEDAVDDLIESNTKVMVEASEDEFTGQILRPKTGVVDSSEVSEPRPAHERERVTIVRDTVVAQEKKRENDGTVNMPSKIATGEPTVKVRIKKYARFKYGKNYYELYPGDIVDIPEGAKEGLRKAGHLEVT